MMRFKRHRIYPVQHDMAVQIIGVTVNCDNVLMLGTTKRIDRIFCRFEYLLIRRLLMFWPRQDVMKNRIIDLQSTASRLRHFERGRAQRLQVADLQADGFLALLPCPVRHNVIADVAENLIFFRALLFVVAQLVSDIIDKISK
jgi:hypothetical protein